MSRYNVIGFPRSGTTYLRRALQQAYNPEVCYDEPFWSDLNSNHYDLDTEYKEQSKKILTELVNANSYVAKHHVGHLDYIKRIYPELADRLLTESTNLFIYRKNFFKRSLSEYLMTVGLSRDYSEKHTIDPERFQSLCNQTFIDLLYAKQNYNINYEHKLVYEELPTEINSLIKYIGLPQPTARIIDEKPYQTQGLRSYIANYDHLVVIANVVRAEKIAEGWNISDDFLLDFHL